MKKRGNILCCYWLLLSSKFLYPQYISVSKPPKVFIFMSCTSLIGFASSLMIKTDIHGEVGSVFWTALSHFAPTAGFSCMKGSGILLKKFSGKLGSAHAARLSYSLTVVSLFEVDSRWRIWNGKKRHKSLTCGYFDVCMCVSVWLDIWFLLYLMAASSV